jgi:hypothetical protein
MSETIRIRTTPNGSDKYLKVKLDQEFDFIEVLSMKITQEDAYRNFCSDYGVVVGRVIINSGVGLPNARVSIFIPVDDVDKNNPEIKGLYPYSIVTDKDTDGIRYNLLPKSSETNNECFTPVGTFPNKREILDNDELLGVYCKYYKFTTTTNTAGDFMIFGVPLGTYTVHVDADISDIGIFSQRPYDLISQGTPLKFFDSPTKYKGGTNLDKLVQIKSTNYAVNVEPFWGNPENCEIGITRADIDMNYNIRPCAIFMGSIFGDQEKNSINKRCRPRKKLGSLCEQVAGEGSIEMIRKTIDGNIEQFDVEGGRVIDDDGTWAYQIPMNLDYVVTDEFGNLVPTDDETRGIPTRTSVRFKIGMDNTGGEGRLRTRAKYLVPHNPNTQAEIDYTFNERTKNSSFRDLYWNKIYSVSNFIPRYQTNDNKKTRAFTAIKDVDDCVGDKTPFPFNRVNTDFSPIFFIICLIIKIIAFLIYIINRFVIFLINKIIEVINKIINFVNTIFQKLCDISQITILKIKPFGFLSFACSIFIPPIDYIPCVWVQCPFDSDAGTGIYAPGCLESNPGWGQIQANTGYPPNFYPGDDWDNPTTIFGHAAGLDKCVAALLAESLGLFQFDFYNDWINGTLYGYLLKYKRKRRKSERFCEYDCDDFFSQGGVDGNKNNVPDNNCRNNYYFDSCFNGGDDSQDELKSRGLREGLIKKVDTFQNGKKINEEFFYAASLHNASAKLFATDIICLGSVFDCDWQGIPKVQSLLIPTTYKIPPIVVELTDDNTTVETTGQVGTGPTANSPLAGLFFEIDCKGLHSNYRQCLNIRHINEFGVDIDQLQFGAPSGAFPNGAPINTDQVIGVNDIDENGGIWFRDVFYELNRIPNQNAFTLTTFTTSFNTQNLDEYPFGSDSSKNGQNYLDFRGYPSGAESQYAQTKHSYFFYFGIIPGKGALEKMNQRFFTRCLPVTEKEFNILASTQAATSPTSNGSITFTVISGTAPFTYIISGPNGYNNTGTIAAPPAPQNVTINVPVGTYTIEVVDANGNVVTQSTTVDGPPALYATATVTKQCSSATVSDGEITITSIGGGTGVWTYKLLKSNGQVAIPQTSITSAPLIIPITGGLGADTGSDGQSPANFGYKLIVNDGVSTVTITNLVLSGPTPVVLSVTTQTPTTCWLSTDGGFTVAINGGQGPYTTNITGPNNFQTSNLTVTNIPKGNYTVTTVDNYGTTDTLTITIPSLNVQLGLTKASASELSKQCNPNSFSIPFYVTAGASAGSVKIQYNVDDQVDSNSQLIWNDVILTYVNSSTPIFLTVPNPSGGLLNRITVRMKSNDGLCFSNILSMDEEEIRLPINTLSVNVTGVDNTKQCTPNVVSFKFNVSHLQAGSTARQPYTFNYQVNGGPTQSVQITTNQQLITTSLPAGTTSASITYTITDNKGCTATGTIGPIVIPSTSLTASWSYNNTANPQTKSLTISGGFAPYTVLPTVTSPKSQQQSVTVTDNVGCTFITPFSTL